MSQSVDKTRRSTPPRVPRPGSLPPHAVILHRDPFNNLSYTVSVLREVFRISRRRALWMGLKAKWFRRCVLWRGSLEVAELKAEQVLRCTTDMLYLDQEALPLHVTVEALD